MNLNLKFSKSAAKRILSLLIAASLAFTTLAGCVGSAEKGMVEAPTVVTSDSERETEIITETVTSSEPKETTSEPMTTAVSDTKEEVSEVATVTTVTEAVTVTPAETEETVTEFTVEEASATMYAKSAVNVRSGPSVNFQRIGHLTAGQEVTVTGIASTGWYRIVYKGEVGYVSNNYLVSEKPAETTTAISAATTSVVSTTATTAATTVTSATTAATETSASSDDKRDDALYTPDYSGTTASGTVSISASKEYQTIIGFGGMNFPVWVSDLTASMRQAAFGNDEGELGFTILRIHIDPNKSNWQKEVATAKAAYDSGALVIASVWSAPDSMLETFTKSGDPDAVRVKHSSYKDYAEYIEEFIEYMSGNGVEVYAVSFQNEPDWAYDWVWWTADEIVDFIVNYSDIISCKLMTPESYNFTKTFYDAIYSNSTALSKIDIIATHLYGTSLSNYSYSKYSSSSGKELWMTEQIQPDSSIDGITGNDWPLALDCATSIHNTLVNGFQTYLCWYIRRFYSAIDDSGSITKVGYCMAHYSKFVRPGYVRVSATESPATGVSVSAYKSDGKLVIVAINNSTKNYSQTFNISGLGFDIGYIEAYTTNASLSLARTGNVAHESSSFGYVLKSYSVTTFVISEY